MWNENAIPGHFLMLGSDTHWKKDIEEIIIEWHLSRWSPWDFFLIWFSRLHFQSSDVVTKLHRPLWSWLYGSWIYNCLCTQCLLPLTLRWQIPLRRGVLHTTLCDEVCQSLAAGRWFSPGTPVSSINKTYRHNNEYNWNIVESGIKHHNPYPSYLVDTWFLYIQVFEYQLMY